MPQIAPFRAILYNSDLDPVVCPPYDKIDARQRSEFLNRSPHNAVRILLPEDDADEPGSPGLDRYSRARADYEMWLSKGILGKHPTPAFYVLRQRFETRDQPGTRQRLGLVALLRIGPENDNGILGHERTFEGPRLDREKLADSLQADLDQIMLLAADPDAEIRTILAEAVGAAPALRRAHVPSCGLDSEELHALHPITDELDCATLARVLESQQLIIADGHHRFGAATAAAKKLGHTLWRTVAIFPIEDPDLVILPTHRLVRSPDSAPKTIEALDQRLGENAQLEPRPSAAGSQWKDGEDTDLEAVATTELAALPDIPGASLVLLRDPSDGTIHLRRLIPREGLAERLSKDQDFPSSLQTLDIALVQKILIDDALEINPESLANAVDYHRHVSEGLSALCEGAGDVLLLVRPVSVRKVLEISQDGTHMPQKTTDFYPKLLSGLVGFDWADSPNAQGQPLDPSSSDNSAIARSPLSARSLPQPDDSSRPKLFIPGPVEVAPSVLRALSAPMIGHRGAAYRALHAEMKPLLRDLFMTEGRVLLLTASATGGMEAAVRSCVNGRVLNLVNGAFSQRWNDISVACGKQAVTLEADWGKAIRPQAVRAALQDQGPFDALTLVHSETSTGVLNPLPEISAVLREFPETLLLVDSVSSLGTVAIPVDRLRIDVCVAGTQKGLGLPPGLALVAINDRALDRAREVPNRGYYLDLVQAASFDDRDMTPSTPALSLMYGLRVALERIFDEGLTARFHRHLVMAARCRAWAKERFALYPEEPYVAFGLTAVSNTREIDVGQLNAYLSERGALIANGYGKLKNETFRIGHMAETTLEDLDMLLSLIDEYLLD